MSFDFRKTICANPIGIIDDAPNFSVTSLSLVKDYMDDVIRSQKNSEVEKSPLDEIFIEGLDANQVWQQVRLVLESSGSNLLAKIGSLHTESENLSGSDIGAEESEQDYNTFSNENGEEVLDEFEQDVRDDDDEIEDDDDDVEVEDDDEEVEYDDEVRVDYNGHEGQEKVEPDGRRDDTTLRNADLDSSKIFERNGDQFGLNDDFFDLDTFNKQTAEAENEVDGEDSINFFEDVSSEEDEEAEYYEDFFDPPTFSKEGHHSNENFIGSNDKEQYSDDVSVNSDAEYDRAMESAKMDLFADADEDATEQNDNDNEKLSTFQRQQLDIQRQIAQLEKEAIAEKKWALKGEVKANDRPDDALLTEEIDFERTSKPVPVITAEMTESLEDMIRRRVLQNEFDDLARRVMTNATFSKNRPQFELSDAKSTKSLAELYEADYEGAPQVADLSEELKHAHDEISELYKDLVYKLDALSSAHFVPKPAQKQLEVKVQSAAINMEDSQPLTMSTAPTLAPQEVYNPGASRGNSEISLKNGVVMSREELSREDKNRLRRALKRKRSKHLASKKSGPQKKSKKSDVIDTLSQARNVTIIDKKGKQVDVKGNVKKFSTPESQNFKL
ncbi:LADA_0D10550g1_1 [Lachancea dasiensis]|uniref:U3 small nucleolar ribonucleoprotein protein MPP10 n=1 Tax=Lachancea dasiensis TaxID=1072105 RepID=A0A1G4J7N2_9SACH|nr:LADA_0D10550g1_1 [Lachancea dasiensis]